MNSKQNPADKLQLYPPEESPVISQATAATTETNLTLGPESG